MSLQQRIALVGADEAVRTTFAPARRRVVRSFVDLHAELPAITQFQPHLLVWRCDAFAARELGAAELLAALLPATQLVVLLPPAEEATSAPLAAEHGIQLLTLPLRQEAVVALLAAEPVTTPAGLLEPLTEMVSGLTDALNNPLQLAQGHLQLLQAALPPGSDGLLPHLQAIRAALARVDGTLQSLRRVGRRQPAPEPVELDELVYQAAERLPDAQGAQLRTLPAPHVRLTLARAAWLDLLHRFVTTAAALGAPGTRPELTWAAAEPVLQATLRLPDGFPAWRLPPTFAPFLLTRLLRDSPHVLELFLVQVLAAAHGGRARACRIGADRLRLDLAFPAG